MKKFIKLGDIQIIKKKIDYSIIGINYFLDIYNFSFSYSLLIKYLIHFVVHNYKL